MKNLHTKKTSNGSSFGWLIRQMSINQKRGRKTFRRRFVSGSIFVSPCPPECYFQSERKIEPDLRLITRSPTLRLRSSLSIFLNTPSLISGYLPRYAYTHLWVSSLSRLDFSVYSTVLFKQMKVLSLYCPLTTLLRQTKN